MEKELNITNVINTLKYLDLTDPENEVTKSYRWESWERTTFPVELWIDILMDYLYWNIRTGKIEEKYKKHMPSLDHSKSSKNEKISSLARILHLTKKQDYEKIQKINFEVFQKGLKQYITDILAEHKSTANKNSLKIIASWETYININNNGEIDTNEALSFRDSYKGRKVEWQNISFNHKVKYKTRYVKTKENNYDNQILEVIGSIGEDLFYDQLVMKYGYDNVTRTSTINKYEAYDFIVNIDGKKLFYEVKSTASINMIFYLSRNEYEFRKTIKDNNEYIIVFITNLIPKINYSYPIIRQLKNPSIEINLEEYGFWDDTLFLAPYKFKGMI